MNYKTIIIAACCCVASKMSAQYNIDRLLTSGQIALSYDDYVLSIQYFNQVIALKPYIYQPWLYRATAKFYLEDFLGAEDDVSQAIKLNPFVDNLYDLRAISRIRQNKHNDAIRDYSTAIRLNPTNRNYWLNRAICRLQTKDYKQLHLDVDTIIHKWTKMSQVYALNSEAFLQEKDTISAVKWLDKSLKIDPYNADAWTTRAFISLAQKRWRDADAELSKTIHLKPKLVGNYVNRALARFNLNNLRGAMADYDMALDLDPNNFLAHYNRGLLRMQLGDDNRAILDFDFVIRLEPQNMMAVFNRALLHDKTGNLRAAIRDYTTVINSFPNFWTGLSYRANCYRRLGMTAKAELDEFKIFKAQMNKHLGIQPRWTKQKKQAVRKRSEIDIDKYNQMVISDDNVAEHEYQSEYRGRVQNRTVALEVIHAFALTYLPYVSGVNAYQLYDKTVEEYNNKQKPINPIYISCSPKALTEAESKKYFDQINELSERITAEKAIDKILPLLLQRAIAYGVVQNIEASINDCDTYLSAEPNNVLALWQRGACQLVLAKLTNNERATLVIRANAALNDFEQASQIQPSNAYLQYNRGNANVLLKNNEQAIQDYSKAIALDAKLAEAYFNRGIVYIEIGKQKEGIADLSKAGELGLYNAYAVIKQLTGIKR